MKATLQKVFGYQGNPMNLPVPDLAAALPFYQTLLGFQLVSESGAPNKAAVLARDRIQLGLAENGGDPSLDGCAFHVAHLDALFAEFSANGLGKQLSKIGVEQRKDGAWNVFYVVAPDGLCYWFGERQAG